MKKSFTQGLFVLFLSIGSVLPALAQQSFYYDFRNTFDEVSGSGPALNVLGTGAFVDEGLTELSCVSRTVYSFTQNSGVQFDNTVANDFIGNTYSIEMYFEFTNNSGFKRIIDYKNQTTDFGLYSTATQLQFYDALTINTTAFVANQYVYLALTRDSASNDVAIYVDGLLAGTFVDTAGLALLDGSNLLSFFRDDLVFGGEAQPGRIALLKIHDTALDAVTIGANFTALETTSGTVAFSADVSSACFNGNIFNFTNLSANSGGYTYTWEFGDATSLVDTNASHSYAAAGIYNVLLIADDGSGCVDSVSTQVEVYAATLLDLGPDLVFCDGDSAVLDAGSGFVSYLWSTGGSGQTITVMTSGVYTVTVANSTGCSVSDTITVSVNAPLLIALGADTTICDGNTVTLDAGAGFQIYNWSDGSMNTTLDVSATGTYSVMVTDFNGCTESDTIEVTVSALPIVDLGVDTTICGGTVFTLDAGPGFVTYLWNDGSANQTLDVTTGGLWAVDVTDSLGCSGRDDIILTVTPLISLGPDQLHCAGDTITLDAGIGFSAYLWNDGSSINTLEVTTSGTYIVTVTDSTGCVNFDDVEITFNNVPIIDFGPDFSICDNDIAILDAGAGFYSYLWNDGSTDSVLYVTMAGTYSVIVSSAPNCDATDSVTITVLPLPILELGADSALCDGNVLTLDAGAGFINYQWSDGSSNQTLDVTTTGVYYATITDANGCENTDSITVSFEGPPFLELGPDQTICSGTATVLDAGPGMASYLWSDGSLTQMLLVSTAGTYAVTITSTAGCTSQDSTTISVLNSPVVALGADTSLCDGEQLLLDAGSGFMVYMWNDGSALQTLNVTTAGIYTVVVTDANNCNGTDDIEVLYFAPVPTPTITQMVNTLQSSAVSGNQWYAVPGGIIPGATGQTFMPGQDGTYYVVVTDSNGCVSAASADFVFVLDGLPTISAFSVNLVPNPATNLVTVLTTGFPSGTAQLEVINIIGKMVYSINNQTNGKIQMNVSTLPEGIYFVKLTSGNYSVMKRLVINR